MRKSIIGATVVVLLAATPGAAQVTVATGVAADATEANSQPKMARDRHGTIYLTFVKPVDAVAQVFFASSSDDGRSWKVQPETAGRTESRFPALAIGPDNHVHLAWTRYDDRVGKVDYARFDGARWTAPQRVSPGVAYAGVPALAIDPQGQPHLVWYGIRNQALAIQTRHGSLYEILYSRFSGGHWTQPELISPGIPDSINATLAIDRGGRFHSAWYQSDLRTYQVRHAKRARAWDRPQQVSSGEDASAVAMAVGGDDAVYLVWERHENAGSRIYFAERDTQWRGQQPISSAERAATDPSIAVDDRGRIYVTWTSNDQIYLAQRDRQWLGIDRVTTQGRNDHAILASTGNVIDLMWTQQVNGERRLVFTTLTGRTNPAQSSDLRGLWAAMILALILATALWRWRRLQGARRGG